MRYTPNIYVSVLPANGVRVQTVSRTLDSKCLSLLWHIYLYHHIYLLATADSPQYDISIAWETWASIQKRAAFAWKCGVAIVLWNVHQTEPTRAVISEQVPHSAWSSWINQPLGRLALISPVWLLDCEILYDGSAFKAWANEHASCGGQQRLGLDHQALALTLRH